MPLGDDRDQTHQNNPSNPNVRNPYSDQTWNMGGGFVNGSSYGWGSNNYGSAQAQYAYNHAQQLLKDAEQRRNTRYPAGVPVPGQTGFYDENHAGVGEVDGFGEPPRQSGGVTPMPSTTTQGMAPQYQSGGSSFPEPPGSFGGSSTSHGGSSYNPPGEDERVAGVLQNLTRAGQLDNQRAQALFDLWKKKQAEGQKHEDFLTNIYQGVLGSNGNVNPNDPHTFGLLAGQVQQNSADRDAELKALEQSGLTGGELEKAKAAVIARKFTGAAFARQNLIGEAMGYFDKLRQQDQLGYTPGQASGADAQQLGYLGQKYGQDLNAATSIYGTDTGRDLGYYNTDVGAATARRGQDLNETQSNRNYQLALEQLKLGAKSGKTAALGGLLNTLGQTLANKYGGSGGGGNSNPYGGQLGNFANWDGSTQAGGYDNPNLNRGQFLDENGGYGSTPWNTGGGGSVPSFLDPNTGYGSNNEPTWAPPNWGD